MPFQEIVVGKVYPPLRQASRDGIVTYNYTKGGHLLTLTVPRPSDAEIDAIRGGPVEFRLAPYQHVIFLLFKIRGFNDGAWVDAPFSYYLNPPDRQQLPPPLPTPESRDTIQLIFADSQTAIVKALRVLSFSPAFTVALHGAIQAAAKQSVPARAYDAEIAAVYRQHAMPDDLAKSPLVVASCTGGE